MLLVPTASAFDRALRRAADGDELDAADLTALIDARGAALDEVLTLAAAVRDDGLERAGRGRVITYSRKVFIPVTRLCRDRCHYCIFVDTPGGLLKAGEPTYLDDEEVLRIAAEGAALGCKEALFTLGDRPETRWPAARDWLAAQGHASTLDYIGHLAERVLTETGLIPHLNPGVMSWNELQRLRPVAGSMGMMLETTATRLFSERGGVHYGSPDKDPVVRMRVLEDAGRSRIPFTTGVLLGIGETSAERADAILAIKDVHERYGNVQETIVQNFRAKPRTAAMHEPDLELEPYLASIAATRLAMGPDATVQAPPNLTDPDEQAQLLRAGIDDWGGVSPLTADHVNPERPWPDLDVLAERTAAAGYVLHERLTAHPRYLRDGERWLSSRIRAAMTALADPVTLLADEGTPVVPFSGAHAEALMSRGATGGADASRGMRPDGPVRRALDAARAGDPLDDDQAAALLGVRDAQLDELAGLADRIRAARGLHAVTHVVNRNLDGARFGVDLDAAAVDALVREAVELGATEICVQGAPPAAAGSDAHLELARTVRAAAGPGVSLHAFRPAELREGAARMRLPLPQFLVALREAGVTSVPGTGAKVLDDVVRAQLSGGTDIPVAAWIETVSAAHEAGLRSTSTLVYGSVETDTQLIAHLRTLRRIQERTGGFTEFIPMPFVPAEAPRALAHRVGLGPSPERARAVVAVARLLLDGAIDHIQTAWTKLGLETTADLLGGGADDLGGLLLDGALRPDAGPEQGLTLDAVTLAELADAVGRPLARRTTEYGVPVG